VDNTGILVHNPVEKLCMLEPYLLVNKL